MPLTLEAIPRPLEEKAKKIRQNGFLPAILYGRGQENIELQVSQHQIKKLLKTKEHIIELHIEGKKELSIVQELQRDVISAFPLHVSFLRVKKGTEISLTLTVHLEGVPIGIKSGGVLNHALREVEVTCTPENIPESLSVDVTKMNIGDTLHVSDIPLPTGISIDKKVLTMELASVQIQKVETEAAATTEEAKEEEKTEEVKGEKEEKPAAKKAEEKAAK